jgi:hypothetical protein
MHHRLRLFAATTILGIVPVLAATVYRPDRPMPQDHALVDGRLLPAPQDKQPDPESAKSCALCHTEIYKEWSSKGQMHAEAWTDPVYQNKLKTKKRAQMCYACHIPERVLARVGRKPKTRENKELWHEGVNCTACHEKDGAMHGPFGAKTDAHGSSGLCLSCHKTKIDVVLPVGKDFVESGLEQQGKSCVGCHMEEVERHLAVSPVTGKAVGEKRKGRSHYVLGPNDAEFCGTAFEMTAKPADGQMILSVANKAGHRVPGLRIRAFHFHVQQQDGAGKAVAQDKVVVDSENGLKVLETRQFPFKLAAGAKKVEVRIEHHFDGNKVADVKLQTLDL